METDKKYHKAPESLEFTREQFNDTYTQLSKLTPSIINLTTPDQESKLTATEALLSGNYQEAVMNYPKIEALTDSQFDKFNQASAEVESLIQNLPEKEQQVYYESVKNKGQQTKLAFAMRDYNQAETLAKKYEASLNFMEANIELYGEPNKDTYLSLLSEKIAKITNKNRSFEAEQIFQELQGLLPVEAFNQEKISDRFRPDPETISWMHDVANELYGGLLKHVPENDNEVDSEKLQQIFQEIIDDEFGEAGEGWRVELKNTKAVSVNSGAKRISIPTDRQAMTSAEVRRLTVHEIGIHMLTALSGGSTSLVPLKQGLSGYTDTQEGLAKVMEQALDAEFKEVGVEHYITAGLAYFEGMSLAEVYEAKWRMQALENLDDSEVPSEENIKKAKLDTINRPGKAITRIFRGTDELPLFKDLSYYNGAVEVWRYLDSIRGDDFQLALLLAGKISTSKEHQRIILESRSV